MTLEPELIGIPEAAIFLGIGRSKLCELLALGQIQKVKIGRRTLCRVSNLREFSAKQHIAEV